MLAAENFFSSQAMLLVVVGLGLAAFALAWLLLGTAARVKADRDMAARMAAIGRPVPQTTASASDKAGTGWIPESVSSFGERFAQSRGFSEKLDAPRGRGGQPPGGRIRGRHGGDGAARRGPRRRDPQKPPAGVIGLVAAAAPTVILRSKLNSRRQDAGAAAGRPDDHAVVAPPGTRSSRRSTRSPEIPAPANVEFQRLVAEIRLGRPAEDALEALADRVGSADFRWAVLAVNIQREVGGNLAEILDNVSDTLRERATMRRQIKVLTAEGRLSAWVLALLPFAIAVHVRGEPRVHLAAVHHASDCSCWVWLGSCWCSGSSG